MQISETAYPLKKTLPAMFYVNANQCVFYLIYQMVLEHFVMSTFWWPRSKLTRVPLPTTFCLHRFPVYLYFTDRAVVVSNTALLIVTDNLCPLRHTYGAKSVVCKHWLRGLCTMGDQCEFLHEYDMTKMPRCFFYSNYGELYVYGCTNTDPPLII